METFGTPEVALFESHLFRFQNPSLGRLMFNMHTYFIHTHKKLIIIWVIFFVSIFVSFGFSIDHEYFSKTIKTIFFFNKSNNNSNSNYTNNDKKTLLCFFLSLLLSSWERPFSALINSSVCKALGNNGIFHILIVFCYNFISIRFFIHIFIIFL